MSASDLAKVPASSGPVIQIPDILGGRDLSYNLPGVTTRHQAGRGHHRRHLRRAPSRPGTPRRSLRSTRGSTLPSNAIVPEVRADSSGTTYIFTDYLTTAAPSVWTLGASKTITWPSVAVQTPKNSGVASSIKSTPYSIGYVELAYAIQNRFTYAAVKNAAGNYVVPSRATVAADADQKTGITPTNFSIVNAAGRHQLPHLRLQLGHPAAEADQRHHGGRRGQGPRLDHPHRWRPGPGRQPGLRGAAPRHPEHQIARRC